MAVFKCKMCGGAIEVNQGESVGICEYCGTKQTLPKLDDDRKVNLYDRANHFRRNNDYDKAMGIYEQILSEDNTDAEAYWSLVLCKYGIEYVEDPATHKRVPTVNRAQYTSIFADEDYKSAVQYADAYQKSIYEEEAKAIDEIQKGILEISQKEKPFDVFICYKETGNDGRRTPDSVLATELYHELTREGFKVFFSRITLEDKLGTAYEPYIFAALNSSKVMVVLGTKAEYFNAVWVKNEWSRFLALIKNGERKTLIPAYKDMDPYDLPEEFSHLQAQDMSKLGFMSDLVRGINKIIDSTNTQQKETVIVSSGNAKVEPLLKRAYIFLEDGDWNSADQYCERVLDLDPENARAYLGKMLSELKIKKQEELKYLDEDFSDNKQYAKILRYANDNLKDEIESYISFINNRNCEKVYSNAVKLMSIINTREDAEIVANQLSSIIGYKDSESLIQKCYDIGEQKETELTIERYKKMIDMALTESEIVGKLAEMSVNKSNPDIQSFIERHKNEYKKRVKKAQDLFSEFNNVKERISSINSQLESLISEVENAKSSLEGISKKRRNLKKYLYEAENAKKSLYESVSEYEKVEKEIAKTNKELSGLSAFSFKQRKQAKTWLKNMTNGQKRTSETIKAKKSELETIRTKLLRLGSEEEIDSEEGAARESLNEKRKLLEQTKKGLGLLQDSEKLGRIKTELALPKYLITLLLSNNNETISTILSEDAFLYTINHNAIVQKTLTDNPLYHSLPDDIQKKVKRVHKQSLDAEAIYYQASQALEFGNATSDFVWAKEQFQKIIDYKDSDKKVSECNQKIAGL